MRKRDEVRINGVKKKQYWMRHGGMDGTQKMEGRISYICGNRTAPKEGKEEGKMWVMQRNKGKREKKAQK